MSAIARQTPWRGMLASSAGDLGRCLGLLAGETSGFALECTIHPSLPQVYVKDDGNVLSSIDDFFTTPSGAPKLVFGEDGLLGWQPHNLITNSEAPESWGTVTNLAATGGQAADSTGAMTLAKLDEGTATGTHNRRTSVIAMTAGQPFTVAAEVRSGNSNVMGLDVSNMSGSGWAIFDLVNKVVTATGALVSSATITDLGGGLCKVKMVLAPSASASGVPGFFATNSPSNGPAVSYTGTNRYFFGGRFHVYLGSVEIPYRKTTSAAFYGAAIEKDPITGKRYWLIEPTAATNLFTNSRLLQTGWSATGGTGSSAATQASPSGLVEGYKLIESTGSTVKTIRQIVAFTSGVTYRFSGYFKVSSTDRHPIIALPTGGAFTGSSGGLRTHFNPQTLTFTGGANCTNHIIKPIGNGWYYCAVSCVASASTNGDIHFGMAKADGTVVYAGDGTTNVHMWGLMCVAGPADADWSYIPTFAATVTRAADDPNFLLTKVPWSATEGTLYIDFETSGDPTAGAPVYFWGITDETVNNVIGVRLNGSSYQLVLLGGTTLTHTVGADHLGRSQLTVSWKDNDNAGSLDGAAASTTASGTVTPNPLTTMHIGRLRTVSGAAPAVPIKLYRVVYVPRRVANADLPNWRYAA